MNNQKIVVFTGDFGYGVRKGVEVIDAAIPSLTWMVVVHSPRKKLRQLVRNQWTNFKKNGWRWIPYQAGDAWLLLKAKREKSSAVCVTKPLKKQGGNSLPPNMKIVEVSDIHADTTLSEIKAFAPTLGLSLAAPILQRSLFSIPTLGTLNLHKGALPAYRGMPPAFWELWNDETSVGCTIHWVDDRLDAGEIVLAASIPRAKYSTVRGMQLCLEKAGIDLMCKAVQQVLAGDATSVKQQGNGTTYRKPTLKQIELLRSRLLQNQTPTIPFATHLIKRGISTIAVSAWKRGLSNFVKPRVTVLLYHRVTDASRDNLTVGIEQFDRQMGLLREHCQVLSIEDVLLMEVVPKASKPLVCVTFDDGYYDNYTNAAQILLRHNLPAAFFVSTGLIGTETPFAHDIKRGNPPIPKMNWDHLREMRDLGFTIGSHTVNHIDCAAEPEEVVRYELVQSRDDLKRELGLDKVLLGYPYGGRQHMTPQRLVLVKQAGYVGCLSAYGGANVGTVEPFNVLRSGIHWEFSDQDFLFKCLGLK